MTDRNLTTPEAAERLGVSASYLNKARLTGDGPVYLKLGHKVVYDPADLTDWLNARRRSSTSQTQWAAA
tara:strand:+ start:22 stop:228 length:207 start_codon:yes stop_codon:yes gene_type:complete